MSAVGRAAVMSSQVLLVLLMVVARCSSLSSGPCTAVPQGRLRGKWFTTREGRKVDGFLSIPYAAPPVGQLRFESPQPALPWVGEYSATVDAPGCIQSLEPPRPPNRPTVVSEDCLYLNVFSPNVKAIHKYPVLVFIYGGSFETSSANSSVFGPDYFLDENIVLVGFNYRGGILGFLCLNDLVLPGNLGLKDQRAALRWVKDNIAHFGGDPDRITIFGQSAGAASVQFHLMFTNKEGLFRAGICDSGSSLTPFALQRPTVQKPLVDRLAELTNCPRQPSELLLECLRKLPAEMFETLRQELGKTDLDIKKHVPVFTPVIEPPGVIDAIITADPWDVPLNFPILQGVNQYDGLFRTNDFEVDKTDRKFMELNDNYKTVLPYNLYIESTTNNPENVAMTLKTFYFQGQEISRKNYLRLVEMFSDGLYNYPLTVSTNRNRAKTYVYQLNYKGANTIVHYLGSTSYYGVSHADELFYLFPFGGPTERNITAADTAFSKKLVKLWTNFATYMNPTPVGSSVLTTRWTPVKTQSIEFLNITQNYFIMEENFLKQRIAFWATVPFRDKVVR